MCHERLPDLSINVLLLSRRSVCLFRKSVQTLMIWEATEDFFIIIIAKVKSESSKAAVKTLS